MSKRCRGSSRSGSGSPGIPSPAAVTIVLDDVGGDNNVIITVWPNEPDTGGQWVQQRLDGFDWIDQDFADATGSNFVGQPLWPLTTTPGTSYRVIERGGGIQFAGDSPPSNVVIAV
jgi:hypothetical protein